MAKAQAAETGKSGDKGKKPGVVGIVFVFLGVFILVPVLIFVAAYFFSDTVKHAANPVLSQLPGPIGSFFDNQPTVDEMNTQVQQIADYLLSIDSSRAIDKLKLIKKDDEKLYNEVIKGMLRENPTDAENLLEKIRQSNLQKNVLTSTIDSIKTEQDSVLKDRAKYIDSLTLKSALGEIQTILDGNKDGIKQAGNIIQYSSDIKAAIYLENLQPQDRSGILNSMAVDRASAIRTQIANDENLSNTLKNAAQILSTENMDKQVSVLGDVNTYKLDQLAQIYSQMGPIKAGQILANVPDKNLVIQILNTIKDQQSIKPGQDKLTGDIQNALKVYSNFADNISTLNGIFSAMGDQQISGILKGYFQNGANFKSYPLSNGQEIRISDEDLALAVMKKMGQKKEASIMSFFDSNLASEVSRKLALPTIQ